MCEASERLRLIIVTGSREKNLEAWESAAPIQIVCSAELFSTGKLDLTSALAQLLPSFVAQGSAASAELHKWTRSIYKHACGL